MCLFLMTLLPARGCSPPVSVTIIINFCDNRVMASQPQTRRRCDFTHDYDAQRSSVCVDGCRHGIPWPAVAQVKRWREIIGRASSSLSPGQAGAGNRWIRCQRIPTTYYLFLACFLVSRLRRPHRKMGFAQNVIWSHSNCLWGLDVCGWHVNCLVCLQQLGPSHGNKRPEGERNSVTVMGWAFIVSSAGRKTVQASLHVFTGNYLHVPHCHPSAERICIPAHWTASWDVTDGTYDVCSLLLPFHLFLHVRRDRQKKEDVTHTDTDTLMMLSDRRGGFEHTPGCVCRCTLAD